ncbi:MAG: hypothetical protein KBG22_00745 [Smithella sp.]|nr:hypothetical protein [Smithella sp.]MDM7987955.1 hypothetical protein [Smithella sp.]HOU49959.1 hypothetical protein [Smithella sp.]HQG64804.1 hypothetical protein [Smithella sp.]HQH16028.1 hypothetical protein [Smithella sp.]
MKTIRGRFKMGWFGLMFLVMVMIFGCGGGGVGPGNEFDNLFANWWVDTAGNIDFLYNGVMKLTGYTETSVPNNSIGGDFTFSW